MSTRMDTFTDELAAYVSHNRPQALRVPRDSGRDLELHGTLLGEAEQTVDEHFTNVTIFATVSGKLVGAISRRQPGRPPRHTAFVTDSPHELLEWLASDNKGKLGNVAKAAWVQACKTTPPLGPFETERI